MRKYRGLTKRTRRWAYGYYCQVENKHFIILDDAVIEDPHSFNEAISGFVEVDPETVSQSSGFKDKTGKEELYQDDICEAEYCCHACFDNEPHILRGTIEWSDDGLLMFDYGHGALPLASEELVVTKKLGNIHKNPDLLEQAK